MFELGLIDLSLFNYNHYFIIVLFFDLQKKNTKHPFEFTIKKCCKKYKTTIYNAIKSKKQIELLNGRRGLLNEVKNTLIYISPFKHSVRTC